MEDDVPKELLMSMLMTLVDETGDKRGKVEEARRVGGGELKIYRCSAGRQRELGVMGVIEGKR